MIQKLKGSATDFLQSLDRPIGFLLPAASASLSSRHDLIPSVITPTSLPPMSQSPALLRVLSSHAAAPPSLELPHTEAMLTRQLSRMLSVKQRAAKVQQVCWHGTAV